MPRVHRSTVIDAPAERVWGLLRDFNGHARWHPAVAESRIEDERAGDEVGAVRRFRLRDGSELREQLLTLSDRERSFTYCILESPIPLIGYVATVRLRPVTDGNRTFWDWRSSFSTPPGREAELVALVGEDIYEAGLAGARELLERSDMPRAGRPRGASRAPGRASIACHAIVVERHGGPEQLRWTRVEAPPPGPGEARLRHTAVGVNYIDIYVRAGLYPLLEPPGTPGMEAAGEVVDVGDGVIGILPGDRVAYACPPVGAYAEYRTLHADQLVILPDAIDDETAAALMLKGMTAECLLRRVRRVRRGDTVVVHAAAGGTGLLLCQWARALGATVIGTVGGPDKARLAREHGCEYPIVYTQDDFVARVREITAGRGADMVYDGVGAATVQRSLEALAVRGHLVSYGQASGPVPPFDPAALSAKSATVTRPVLFHYTADPAELRASARAVFEMVARGALRVAVNQRYPLSEAGQAHRDLEARRTTGATVLLP
jgi:NADPH2:quinone reductase